MTKACQTISLPRPVSRAKRALMIMMRSTTPLFHLKLWLTAKPNGQHKPTITGQEDGSRPLFAFTANRTGAKRNGRTSTRTTVLLTAQRGLPFRPTASWKPPPHSSVVFRKLPHPSLMVLLPLRTPPVNPLWMKTIRILPMKVRTLNTNQKIVMTALTAGMTPSTNRECALKDRLGFLNPNATALIELRFQ